MLFDFFDGLGIFGDLLNFLGNSSDLKSLDDNKNPKKKSKYRVELWSGSLLIISSILYFIVFKNPLPENNHVQTLFICVLVGFTASFIVFFALYHLGLYYFKSLFKLLLFSSSVIVFFIAVVFCVYFKSNLFFT